MGQDLSIRLARFLPILEVLRFIFHSKPVKQDLILKKDLSTWIVQCLLKLHKETGVIVKIFTIDSSRENTQVQQLVNKAPGTS